jgi:SAM-dependent methyltransferase
VVDSSDRPAAVVATVAEVVAGAPQVRRVVVHGPDAAAFAADLSAALPGVSVVAGEPAQPGQVTVALRTGWDLDAEPGEPDVVVDFRNRSWPVVRHVAAHLPYAEAAQRRETQAFFALRAPGWDRRFPDDGPAYAAAVAALGPAAGDAVADVGCGTGRALPALRDAVGPGGAVLAVDVTAEMLRAARDRAAATGAGLVLADGARLPLADGALGAVFTAGYLPHVADPEAALRELARVTRPGGRLALFHPVGRAALAARQGRRLRPSDLLAEPTLRAALAATGWRPAGYEDTAERFLALASRNRA